MGVSANQNKNRFDSDDMVNLGQSINVHCILVEYLYCP